MGFSTNPVADADSFYAAQHSRDEAFYQAEAALVENFKSACAKGDANAIVEWAPRVTDFDAMRKAGVNFGKHAQYKRCVTMAEVMNDSLDFARGPSHTEVMQLLMNVANGGDCKAQATSLIDQMAKRWADANTPEVDE
jgi:hypothetical protein